MMESAPAYEDVFEDAIVIGGRTVARDEQELGVSANELTSLPESIGQLASLTTLCALRSLLTPGAAVPPPTATPPPLHQLARCSRAFAGTSMATH